MSTHISNALPTFSLLTPEAQNLAVFFLKNCKVPFVSVQNFSEYLVQFVMFMGSVFTVGCGTDCWHLAKFSSPA